MDTFATCPKCGVSYAHTCGKDRHVELEVENSVLREKMATIKSSRLVPTLQNMIGDLKGELADLRKLMNVRVDAYEETLMRRKSELKQVKVYNLNLAEGLTKCRAKNAELKAITAKAGIELESQLESRDELEAQNTEVAVFKHEMFVAKDDHEVYQAAMKLHYWLESSSAPHPSEAP